jgi:hypothetical protein
MTMSYQLTHALRARRKIDAIKAMREAAEVFSPAYGIAPKLSLKSAKDMVEAILEAFPEPQAQPQTKVGGGDLDRLMIEALPQGGYLVTAAGQTYAMTHGQLSAHTTLGEALAFVGRSMK